MTNRTASPTWRSQYATDISSIDAHHQGLFRILRMLVESTQKGPSKDEMSAILAFLERYIRVHFEGEDAFMARSGFQDAEAHSREHARLTEQLRKLKERFDLGDDRVPGELVPMLSTWLRDHILQQDMALAEHVRARPRS